ncbi:putative O-antigen polymerase [Paenibacillus agaridevorans]|uniref:Putative O-antigen polymerase n=2 Tax=Paenibacillus agaridevorans TaxID=171404 RepID=A0A2R5EN77_9BACL|nr:putative O-antigen polymerase [Paenibacillus agaridevorans]
MVPFGITLLGIATIAAIFSTDIFTKLLPDSIQSRIENINFQQNSVLERGTFYSDAWKAIKDYPMFGAGGGAWGTFYEKYQNNPYISSQTHNFFLQVLLEIGFMGFAVLIILLVGVYFYFIRSYFRSPEIKRIPYLIFFIFTTAILLHSILDFNMSYVFLSFLVFICLGGMLAINDSKAFKWQKNIKITKQKYLYPITLAIGCSISLFLSLNHLSASTSFRDAQLEATNGGAFHKLMETVNTTIARSSNPEFYDLKLQLLLSAYNQTPDTEYIKQAEEVLKHIKTKEAFFKRFVYRELEIYMLQQQYTQASELLEAEIPNYPWDIDLYVELASVYFETGLAELDGGSSEVARAEWDKAKLLFNSIQNKAKELNLLSEFQYQGREFGLTPELALPLGQIAFYEGNYSLALEYLSTRLDQQFNDANDIEATIYYAAALNKMNDDNISILQDMYDKLNDEDTKIVKSRYELLLSY